MVFKFYVLCCLPLLLLSSAMAKNIQCENKNETVKYVEIGYNQGVPPRETDLVRTIQIYWKEELVSTSVYLANGDKELGPVSSWLKKEKMIKQQHLPYGYKEEYTATLKLLPSQFPEMNHIPKFSQVYCYAEVFFYP